MFERLVQNGVDFRGLTHQRRMVPEIRHLLTPIYDNLQDHQPVNSLTHVPGLGNIRSFFFCHRWAESTDSLFSKYNHYEAIMITTVFLHLVLAGTGANEITVLTFYNGQSKKILKLLKENKHLLGKPVKVRTVDSYQGEENEVVLLSLVRSNQEQKIGFLAIGNRVCVALSRARRGFLIFGNGESLATVSPLWWELFKIMGEGPVESRRIRYHLSLTCANHGNPEFVQTPEDIMDLNGGCRIYCEAILDCGHCCPLRCHVFDHSIIQCEQTCGRLLDCGHTCGQKCSADICRCSVCGQLAKNSRFTTKSSLGKVIDARQQQQQQQKMIQIKATLANPAACVEKVRKYQEFATNGVGKHDHMLEMACEAETTEKLLARLDAQAEACLFAEDRAEMLNAEGCSTTVGDDKDKVNIPTRKRCVHSYDPAEVLKITINPSFLDL